MENFNKDMINKKIGLFLFIICLSFCVQAQISENFQLEFSWDEDTIPNVGGIVYNDIWGLTDCDGAEYALMGSTEFIHVFKLDGTYQEVGQVKGGGLSIWRDIKTYDELAYGVADMGEEGLLIIDLRDLPSMIENVDTIPLANRLTSDFTRAHNIFIDQANSRLYVAGSNGQSNGLIIYDLFNDPLNPTLLASVELPEAGYVHDVYVRDNIAYCSHGYNGYYIWDMTNPEAPILLANTQTNGYNHSSCLSEDGKYAFVAEEVPAGLPMLVIDLNNMMNGEIEIVHSFSEPLLAPEHEDNTPHNPFVRGDKLYISYYEDGIQVFDIQDPLNPERLAYYDTDPDNTAYNGTENNWGAFPFFPSGKVIASDTENGLFVLNPNFDYSPLDHIPISNTLNIQSYNCDSKTYRFKSVEGYLSYTLYESDTIYSQASDHQFEVPAGEYKLFLNNGDCTNTSANIFVGTFFLSPLLEPEGEISSPAGLAICENISASLNVSSNVGFVRWFKDGEAIPFADNLLEVNIAGAGEYWAVLYNHDPTGFGIDYLGDCSFETEHLDIEVYEIEIPNIINDNGLLSTNANQEYQWYFNGVPIENADAQFFQALESGVYYVEVIDENGCFASSEEVEVIITSIDELNQFDYNISPNPVKEWLYLELVEINKKNNEINVYSTDGELVLTDKLLKPFQTKGKINIAHLAAGLYYVQVEGHKTKPFIKF